MATEIQFSISGLLLTGASFGQLTIAYSGEESVPLIIAAFKVLMK
jgi:hypothetical protein